MEEYKSNSHASKRKENVENKEIKPVINGSAKTKKKSELRKFADMFISDDVANIKNYIIYEVIIPGVKDVVMDSISMLLGRDPGYRRRTSSNNGSRTSYQRFYDKGGNERKESSVGYSRFNYNDVVFETRGDAELVLAELDELMDQYKVVSIQDLYSAAGLECPYTYNNYGWTDIRSANVIRIGDEFMIKLPKAKPL